jgi:ribonuclease Z
MKRRLQDSKSGISRRDSLKFTGLALGGLAFGGAMSGPGARAADDPSDPAQRYTYFQGLDPFAPGTPLGDDEMRITFMGSGFPPPRRGQAEMSVFVEVGPWVIPDPKNNPGFGRATDSFIFDCGSGVSTNYSAMGISASRMDKVFLNHLHGDHLNDLSHIYWMGPAIDRKSPLYVWGPGPSGILCPAWGDNPAKYYDDGTRAFCQNLREALRWATESFSFQTTSYEGYDTPTREGWVVPDTRGPVSDDPPADGYALIPIELNWRRYGRRRGDNVAYYNPTTGVRITHFPVIHCRQGSIGYKLEWHGLSMVYTSDTKPEYHSIHHGSGVDVFIHEMILPADYLTMKTMHLDSPDQVPALALGAAKTVQNSSHTPQGAYGYLLSQMKPAPRLAVATHFTVSDDTVALAMESVRAHVPGINCDPSGKILDGGTRPSHRHGNITWSTDLMVLRVFPDRILVQRGVVSDYTYQPYPGAQWPDQNPPKYDDHDPSTLYGDAYAQIDMSTAVPATDPRTGRENYREDGY